jgi:hypothetical protein
MRKNFEDWSLKEHEPFIIQLDSESKSSTHIAAKLVELYNIEGKIDNIARSIRNFLQYLREESDEVKNTSFEKDSVTWDERDDAASFIAVTRKVIHTKEQAIELAEVDLDVWQVERFLLNSWGVTNGKGEYFTNYQVKLWFKRRKQSERELESILTKKIAESASKSLKKHIVKRRSLSVEPNITDLHLGRFAFDEKSLSHIWSLEEAKHHYNEAIDSSFAQIELSEIAEFVLPVGNDMIQIDSSNNMTTRGTPQMNTEFWQTLFEYSYHMTKDVIERLSKIAPVKVLMIAGNHDYDSTFSLGVALQAYFRTNENVEVVNKGMLRTYHRFGANLTGFNHGDVKQPMRLHAAMTKDVPELYGDTKFHSYHIGHLHKNSKKTIFDFVEKDEYYGLDIEICPSMTPTDAWHYKNLYIGNLRRSKTFVNHITEGRIAEFYYNVK